MNILLVLTLVAVGLAMLLRLLFPAPPRIVYYMEAPRSEEREGCAGTLVLVILALIGLWMLL